MNLKYRNIFNLQNLMKDEAPLMMTILQLLLHIFFKDPKQL